jgi:hypothetical protein
MGHSGTPTVVVLVSGRVHTLGREAEAPNALVWSILPGEEGGNASAATEYRRRSIVATTAVVS